MVLRKILGKVIGLVLIAICSGFVVWYVSLPSRIDALIYVRVQIYQSNGVAGGNGVSYVINDSLQFSGSSNQPLQPRFEVIPISEHVIVPGWRDPNTTLFLLMNVTLTNFGTFVSPMQVTIPFSKAGAFIVAVTFPFANVGRGRYGLTIVYSSVFGCRFQGCARETTWDSWNSTMTIY
jgi:hypothetical protein